MIKKNNQIQNIIKFITAAQQNFSSQADQERLLSAMLSPNELEVISQRILVLQALFDGRSQRDVADDLKIGVATATRGNRMLKENIDLFEKIFHKGSFKK